jgi:L-alanine-DL-glutamate epimerase-like enolase superfamily enzyme
MPDELRSAVISSGKVSAYTIPTDQQPEETDGTGAWSSTTVLVVELQSCGKTSLGYSYTNHAAAQVAKELIEKGLIGRNVSDVPALHHEMDRLVRNWGRPGLVSAAISAVDISLWDLQGRLLDIPLALLLGKVRDEVIAYGSGGFTSYGEKQLLDQLTGWAGEGFGFVKMKVGRDPNADVRRAHAVQKALKGRAELFVDANGAYSRKRALDQAQQFGDLGVIWFEEPVTSDDRIGLHLLVERAPAIMNIAAGEYSYTLDDARLLIAAEAVDVMQADVTRCGGVTNFVKIGNLCEAHHYPFSAHTAPSLHASLCCSVLPAENVEYFHDHVRIEHLFFDGAITAKNGRLKPDLSHPGFGLELKPADAQNFQIFSEGVG